MNQHYTLITSAYNEEEHLEEVIDKISVQTIKPEIWIIVNDGSKDKTGNILEKASNQYPFIHVINRIKPTSSHDFCSKVTALNMAIEYIDFQKMDYIGILDADIIPEKDYYEKMYTSRNSRKTNIMFYTFLIMNLINLTTSNT